MAQSRPYQRLYRALTVDEALGTSILRLIIEGDGYMMLPRAENGPALMTRRCIAKMMDRRQWFTIDHQGAVKATEEGKAWHATLKTENHPIIRGRPPKRGDY